MKLRNLIIAAVAIAGVLAAASCKKDKADKGSDKSILNGQWVCTYELKNEFLMDVNPNMLWDFDAAGGKLKMFFSEEGEPDVYSFDVKDNKLFIYNSGCVENEIVTLDKLHLVIISIFGSEKWEYHFTKMETAIIGKWAISWTQGEDIIGTQFYRFDEGGTGVRLTADGVEGSKIKWWAEPAQNDLFRFVLSIPANDYENTLTIHYIYSDNYFTGYDEANYFITLDRLD